MSDFIFTPALAITQIAFVVPDAIEAARAHSRRYGSGPFWAVEHYPLHVHRYRGKESVIDVTSVYGQWGNITAEFVQQHDDEPSAYRDLVKKGESRIHHFAMFVDDLDKRIAQYEAEGCEAALYGETFPNRLGRYAIMDTSKQLGVMTELYEEEGTRPFYDHLKKSAEGFDGTDPIRRMQVTDI